MLKQPWKYVSDYHFGELARLLKPPDSAGYFPERDLPPWPLLCENPLAVNLLHEARRLPIAVTGALLPDGQAGLGLPVGGVLATQNAVIPRAVGSDIGCQMRLSVFEEPASQIDATEGRKRLSGILRRCTRFGLTAGYRLPEEHPVLEEDWGWCEAMRRGRKMVAEQLGTSGTGNHFVDFGRYEGGRLAFLSHSGSRGIGAATALEFHKLALKAQPHLPGELKAWAWLDLDSEAGTAYWNAMELLVRYAPATTSSTPACAPNWKPSPCRSSKACTTLRHWRTAWSCTAKARSAHDRASTRWWPALWRRRPTPCEVWAIPQRWTLAVTGWAGCCREEWPTALSGQPRGPRSSRKPGLKSWNPHPTRLRTPTATSRP